MARLETSSSTMQYSATPSQGDGDLEVQNQEDANLLNAETSNYNIITGYGGSLLQFLHSNYNCSALLCLALSQTSIFSYTLGSAELFSTTLISS